jgi:hypothetical protein
MLLLTLAAVPPAVEAAVLVQVRLLASLGIPPQITAIRPYNVLHDLRWVLVYHDSWLGFALELSGALVLRSLLNFGLTVLAWPAWAARPPLRELAVRNAAVTGMSALLMLPWAALLVAGAVVSLSWFFLGALLATLLLAPFLQRASAAHGWWHGLPSPALVGWSLLGFALTSLSGALVWTTQGWWAVPAAALCGVLNGLLWERVEHASLAPQPARWRRVPVAPVAFFLTLAAPVSIRILVTTGTGHVQQWTPPLSSRIPAAVTVDHVVIVLQGHGSSYAGSGGRRQPYVEPFSYRGLGGDGLPLPYAPVDTHRSLWSSVDLLAAQVDAAHRRTGKWVALVGQSEGALVTRLYLAYRPHPTVRSVALFSPPVRPGRAYYPPRSADAGWGIGTGWILRGVFGLAGIGTKDAENPDEPFLRSLMDNTPFFRTRGLCPEPGVRMVAFLPTVTAIELPPGTYSGIPVRQLPAFHGGLLGRPSVQAELVQFLQAELPGTPQPLDYSVFQRLGAAWQPPTLALALNPVWRGAQRPDPARGQRACPPGPPPPPVLDGAPGRAATR